MTFLQILIRASLQARFPFFNEANWNLSARFVGNGFIRSVGEAAFADVFIINLAGYSDNLALCQIIGGGKSASRSERINPFPTHILKHFQFNKPAKFQFVNMFMKPRNLN